MVFRLCWYFSISLFLYLWPEDAGQVETVVAQPKNQGLDKVDTILNNYTNPGN